MMNYQIVLADIDPALIAGANDDDAGSDVEGFIYDHLLYYCSKFSPLPAIVVDVDDKGIRVASRGIYLRIAKDLGRTASRAVISSRSSEQAVDARSRRGDIKLLDYEEVRSTEQPFEEGWHVFFFEDDLGEKQLAEFEKLMRSAFESHVHDKKRDALVEFSYMASKRCVEFQALTPVEDHAFATDFRRRLIEFHNETATIASYLGRRFLVP